MVFEGMGTRHRGSFKRPTVRKRGGTGFFFVQNQIHHSWRLVEGTHLDNPVVYCFTENGVVPMTQATATKDPGEALNWSRLHYKSRLYPAIDNQP